jgi:hypothetical protein
MYGVVIVPLWYGLCFSTTTHFMMPHNVVTTFHVRISVHSCLSGAYAFIHKIRRLVTPCLTAYRGTRGPATEGDMEFRPINLNFEGT